MVEEAQNEKLKTQESEAEKPRETPQERGAGTGKRNNDTPPEEQMSGETVPEEAVAGEVQSGDAVPVEEKSRSVEGNSESSEVVSDTQVKKTPDTSESNNKTELPEKPASSKIQVQERPSARPSSPQRRPYGSGRGRNDTQRSGQNGSGPRQRRGYFRRKVCRLCVNKIKTVDYKDIDLLKRFVTDRGKILPRRMTGTCAKHQRVLSAAIKRARMAAFLPFVKK